MKRLFDLVMSSLLILALSPAWGLTALLIKATSRGPAVFRAVRVGKDGHHFTLYKFRSMTVSGSQVGMRITVGDDPRVTRIGKVLRRSKFDETLQLINVVKGEMSLVGPRPEDPAYVEFYTPAQRKILAVRPGMVSPASLMFKDEEHLLASSDQPELTYVEEVLGKKLEIDLQYVACQSLATDLRVLRDTLTQLIIRRERP